MGLLDFLRRLFFAEPRGRPATTPSAEPSSRRSPAENGASRSTPESDTAVPRRPRRRPVQRRRRNRPVLTRLRHADRTGRADWKPAEECRELPYRFARLGVRSGGYLDLGRDGDDRLLECRGLPAFHNPEQLAEWLGLPLGKVAWLIHRFFENSQPSSERQAHYHFRWERKKAGGWRLIESPKATLKLVQNRILEEILNRVPAHPSAHGFVAGRSIVTNARPHVGQRILVRFDLSNFYPTVTRARVTAIFRGLGYSREAAVWLARLCTSALPQTAAFPDGEASGIRPYLRPHLPQGAPTSPAIANLSAFGLDVRLFGLAQSYGANYTRYADDLTFSGPHGFERGLPTFIPLVEQVIREERFRSTRRKRRITRSNARQCVTGAVVNERINIRRAEYDRLKAILTNCLRHGAASQNRDGVEDFGAHLRGRIAHVHLLNPERAQKLTALYERIRWT